MDLLSMIMNAKLKDMDGNDVGEVIGLHIAMGKAYITVDPNMEEDDDPDDGEKEDIPEENSVHQLEFPKCVTVSKTAGS